jgi:hypothetical protein
MSFRKHSFPLIFADNTKWLIFRRGRGYVGMLSHYIALNDAGAGLCTQPLHVGETGTEKFQMRIGD